VATYDYHDKFFSKQSLGKELKKRSRRKPSVEEHTLVDPDKFVEAVKHHVNGKYVEFTFSPSGIVSTVLGKVHHSPHRIVENFEYVLRHLYSIRPEHDGDYVIGLNLNGSKCPGGALPLDIDQVFRTSNAGGCRQ
jgi:ribosomal protein L1